MRYPFPYEPRPHQAEMIRAMADALDAGRHMALESGTGTGKTVCALSAALSAARDRDRKTLYLVRTHSQERQVIAEVRAIRAAAAREGPGALPMATAVQGRHRMCLLARTDPEAQTGGPEELSLYCSERKKATLKAMKGERPAVSPCPYFEAVCSGATEPVLEWAVGSVPTSEELVETCIHAKVCPYETVKLLAAKCDILVAPYVYLLNPYIFRNVLTWLGRSKEKVQIVVDEAHNLPDFARDLGSCELGEHAIKLASDESRELKNPLLTDGLNCNEFLWGVQDAIDGLAAEYMVEDDSLVPEDGLEGALMDRFHLTSIRLAAAYRALVTYGDIVCEMRRKAGRLPRSHLGAIGRFLETWTGLEASTHTKLVKDKEFPRLEIFCMDPSTVTGVVRTCAASVHVSGTLAPLDEYRDSIGLPQDSILETFPSPFPPENRMASYMTSLTTQFEAAARDPGMVERLFEQAARAATAAHPRNCAIFFPSHQMVERFLDSDARDMLKGGLLAESRAMPQSELMAHLEAFKAGSGAVMLGVIGGRLSEGMDFPGSALEVLIIAGIPYPKPTAKHRALLHYYDVKFGKGWEYTVTAPTRRKLLQTAGRLIRTPKDRGYLLIMDRRTVHFADAFPQISASDDPCGDIHGFFGAGRMAAGPGPTSGAAPAVHGNV